MFVKVNMSVLKFNPIDDIDKIIFNHYITRRVNINKINKGLKPGCFSFTFIQASRELDISIGKAQRLIKAFEDLKIIRKISNGNRTNRYSVYEYLTENDNNCDNDNDNNIDNDCDNNNNHHHQTTKTRNTNTLKQKNITNTASKNVKNDNNIDNDIDNQIGSLEIDSKNRDLNIKNNVVLYLNEKCRKNFKPTTTKTVQVINARLKEGYTQADFEKVIDTKSKQWLYTDMNKFLRPQTLFGTKFESYLNEETLNSDITNSINQEEKWELDFDY